MNEYKLLFFRTTQNGTSRSSPGLTYDIWGECLYDTTAFFYFRSRHGDFSDGCYHALKYSSHQKSHPGFFKMAPEAGSRGQDLIFKWHTDLSEGHPLISGTSKRIQPHEEHGLLLGGYVSAGAVCSTNNADAY